MNIYLLCGSLIITLSQLSDSITIIVTTEAPYLSIRDPGGGDIVNGEFYIEGRIEDNDFSAFQLLISNYRAGKNAKMGR